MKLFDLDFYDVQLVRRNLSEYRTFSVEIKDPTLWDNLVKAGAKVWQSNPSNNAEPPHNFLNIVYDNRYGDVQVAALTPEGVAIRYDDRTIADVDKLWIAGADLHVEVKRYTRAGVDRTTAYVKTMVIQIMSEEEQAELKQNRDVEADAVRKKFSNIFGA